MVYTGHHSKTLFQNSPPLVLNLRLGKGADLEINHPCPCVEKTDPVFVVIQAGFGCPVLTGMCVVGWWASGSPVFLTCWGMRNEAEVSGETKLSSVVAEEQ